MLKTCIQGVVETSYLNYTDLKINQEIVLDHPGAFHHFLVEMVEKTVLLLEIRQLTSHMVNMCIQWIPPSL